MKNSNDTTGNRTRDLPVCSAVPQPPMRHRVRQKRTVGSPISGHFLQTSSPRRRKMSTYIPLFRVAITVNFTSEFRELCTATTYKHNLISYIRYLQSIFFITPLMTLCFQLPSSAGDLHDSIWCFRSIYF